MFVSLILCQLIFLLITYANISIASERGARYISMGSLPSEVISKTTLELEKYNFFNGKPKIETEKIDLAETKLIEIKILWYGILSNINQSCDIKMSREM